MALDLGLTVTLPEGNTYAGTYTLQLGDCTGLDDLDIRRETGLTVFGLFNAITAETGMGAIVGAAILWLVRRREFPHMTYGDAARALPWSSDFTIADADAAEGDSDAEGKAEPVASEDAPET